MTHIEFYACGREIESTVVGTSPQGAERTIGSLSVAEGLDLGCAGYVDVQQLQGVTEARLRITENNQGDLLEHEDYALRQVVGEELLRCQQGACFAGARSSAASRLSAAVSVYSGYALDLAASPGAAGLLAAFQPGR